VTELARVYVRARCVEKINKYTFRDEEEARKKIWVGSSAATKNRPDMNDGAM